MPLDRPDDSVDALPSPQGRFRHAIARAKERGQTQTLISAGLDATEAWKMLADVETIFSDLDGSAVKEGSQHFDSATVVRLQRLHDRGITLRFATGRPRAEVESLIHSAPGIPMAFITERGAFLVTSDGQGTVEQSHLLFNDAIGTRLATLRERFDAFRAELEARFPMQIIPAGSGTHESLLSIDVVRPHTLEERDPANRRAIKIEDQGLIGDVRREIERFLAEADFPDFRLTDLGNGNFEIAYRDIHKAAAISEMPEFTAPGHKVIIGDSNNDREAFALAQDMHDASTCVVVNGHTPEGLVDAADFAVIGEGNANLLFDQILEAQKENEELIVVSFTSPFKANGQLSVGGVSMAMTGIIERAEKSMTRWVCTHLTDTQTHDRGMEGTLLHEALTSEENESLYLYFANKESWPWAHLPDIAPLPDSPDAGMNVTLCPPEHLERARSAIGKIAAAIVRQIDGFRAKNPTGRTRVWVQDYQLEWLGQAIRDLRPEGDYDLGFFWHIPYPEPEQTEQTWASVPDRRAEKVRSLGAYDSVGFHCKVYEDRYRRTCELAGITPAQTVVQPISVNARHIAARAQSMKAEAKAGHLRRFNDDRLNEHFALDERRNALRMPGRYDALRFLGRSDPIKGVVETLKGDYALALRDPGIFRDWRYLDAIVPSRQGIGEFRHLYDQSRQLIEDINRKLKGVIGYDLIRLIDTIDQRDDVFEAMMLSDAVFVPSRTDGFNMTAGEAAVIQSVVEDGQLVLSDKTGFHRSLVELGYGDTVRTIESDERGLITPDTIQRATLQMLQRAPLPPERFAKHRRYFQRNNLLTWGQVNLAALQTARFRARFASA